MAIYVITGKLGSGKTLACVGRIRDALRKGRRVVTNLDLYLEHMLPAMSGRPGTPGKPVQVVRIPDKPTLRDLEQIGRGQDGVAEENNGLIVLDELGAWLNTRGFQDKGRSEVINWLLHSRKLGWDVYFIIQHPNMLDKQVREGLAEFLVTCRRTDRLRIPFIGPLIATFTGWEPRPPKVHIGTVRYGLEKDALVVDRWYYQAKDLYSAYDTRQVFTDNGPIQGAASMLSPWHLKGRYLPSKARPWLLQFVDGLRGKPLAVPKPLPKPKRPLVELLGRLPPDQAMKHWRRFEALGAI